MSTDTATGAAAASGPRPLGAIDRWARRALARHRLSELRGGRLVVDDAEGSRVFGDTGADLRARIIVHDPRFYRRSVLGGSLGAAAAYLDGDWDCDDLAALFRIVLRSERAMARLEGGPARLVSGLARIGHALRRNTRGGSRRNIRDHYDLGNDLFALFLDPSMTYSAGAFDTPGMTLEAAQFAKLDRICQKLDLRPEHHVLEIGTGWGSFALHAARHYGCRVTTTTISAAQAELARERIAAAGLEDRITLLTEDYRNLEGQYDRLVSIEMIEAVGHHYLETFFRVCGERLHDDGRMLLQVIVAGDDWYDDYRGTVDFIQRYVFPGALCPSIGALSAALGRARSGLRMADAEDLTEDYAETLRHWRRRFHARADEVRALGYPQRFLRLWDYYLQYCEAGFAERHTGDLQIVLDKPGCRLPPVRPRLAEAPA
ncbi:MAG: cyclopropane-fatty-acyl-phospholipid synthase family protein [Halofilum sp. (in: g-proteobacteria)]|nr:cyclopropane-fatty-acyl-phospholipid synthase family protein [Halofilum sp. (in: g-proteobacteria)]